MRRTTPEVLRQCYGGQMTTISQRELRNNSAAIMRGLEAGESYTVTNRGQVVGRLVPAGATALDGLVIRRAARVGGWRRIQRSPAPSGTGDLLNELREDRL